MEARTQIQAMVDVWLMSSDGIHCMLLKAGDVREVNAALLPVALSSGCIPLSSGQAAIDLPAEPEPDREWAKADAKANEILDAIKLIFQLGDTSNLTVTGDPKIKAIEELLGYTISRAERDEALSAFRADEGSE